MQSPVTMAQPVPGLRSVSSLHAPGRQLRAKMPVPIRTIPVTPSGDSRSSKSRKAATGTMATPSPRASG